MREVVTNHQAKNILVQGVYDPTSAFNNAVQYPLFQELASLHTQNGVNFAWVDLSRLFGAITASMSDFGYTGTTCLLSQNTTVGGCDDPDHFIYWIRQFVPYLSRSPLTFYHRPAGHPSYQTHELINQYTLAVLKSCVL